MTTYNPPAQVNPYNFFSMLEQNMGGLPLSKKAVSYIRVSSRRQSERGGGDDEGYSIPAQRELNKNKALSLGATIVETFIDRGESAKTNDRDDLQAMLKYITENKVDYVIINKVDRFARNRLDDALMTDMIYKSGAALISATEGIDDTPQGMMLHGFLATIAEYYSRNLATEVMKGMNQKVKAGVTPCRAPIGYLNVQEKDEQGREVRYVVVDEERAPLVKLAFTYYSTGDWSVLDLAAYLESRSLASRATPKKPSKPITENKLQKILTNPYYKGIVTYMGVQYEGKHEPLVDTVTWQKVQDVLASHRNGERSRIHNHFLKGLLCCGTCGKRLIVHNAKSQSGAYYPYFVCAGKLGKGEQRKQRCKQHAVLIPKVEEAVEKLYDQVSLAPETRQLLEAWLIEEIERSSESSKAEIADLEKQRRKLKDEEAKLLQAHYAEAVSLELMRSEQQRIGDSLADIETRLAKLTAGTKELRAMLMKVLDLMQDCCQTYKHAGEFEKRLMNQAIFEKIEVNPDGTIEPVYSEIVGLLIDPRLQAALNDQAPKVV